MIFKHKVQQLTPKVQAIAKAYPEVASAMTDLIDMIQRMSRDVYDDLRLLENTNYTSTTLPAASAEFLGKTVIVTSGSSVTYRVCVYDGATYVWNALGAGGGTGTTINPSSTVVSETSWGQSPIVGSSGEYSDGGHSHGTPSLPVAGTDKQVQFNDAGSFGADAKLEWDKANSALKIGDNPSLLPNNPLAVQANVDSYVQVNLQNTSDGTSASADYIITADNGDDSSNYGDFGICNSAYDSDVWDVVAPADTYIFADGGNVAIGSLTPTKKVKFFIGGTEHEAHPADVVAEADEDGLNLPSGKTYRINGVDIVPAGGAGSSVSVELGDVAQVDNTTSGMVIDFDGDDFSASVVGNEVNITLTESVADHLIASDPHTEYQKESEKGNANGYASLGADGLVPSSQLPTLGGGFTHDTIGITIDGGGSVITTGSKGYKEIAENCTVSSWTIVGDVSGSCVIDVKKCTYSGFPTTSSIAGTEKPTLSSAQKNQDLTLSSWSTSLTAGDILEFTVDSASTVTRVTLFIKITKA